MENKMPPYPEQDSILNNVAKVLNFGNIVTENGYKDLIHFTSSSRPFPIFCCSLPSNSSSLPSSYFRSSSVRSANSCLILPLNSFQFPLISSLSIIYGLMHVQNCFTTYKAIFMPAQKKMLHFCCNIFSGYYKIPIRFFQPVSRSILFCPVTFLPGT